MTIDLINRAKLTFIVLNITQLFVDENIILVLFEF